MNGKMARLKYEDGSFHVLESGDHVICAVSGQRILMSELRYWSVDHQEPYSNAEAAVKRMAQRTTS